jgi:putative aldouronate transport system substrate-binding protein
MKYKPYLVLISLVVTVALLVSCNAVTPSPTIAGPTPSPTPEPTVKLSWYFVGNFPQPGAEDVWAKANEIVKKEINAEIEFNGLGWGDYESKMKVMIASGDYFDLCFTSGWNTNYIANASKGAFAPIDEYLKDSPYYDVVGAKFWDGAKVNGKIYAVISNQMMASPGGTFTVIKEYADAVGVNPDSVKTLDDVAELARKIHAKYTDVTPMLVRWEQIPKGHDFLLSALLPAAVSNTTEDNTVVNIYKSDLYKGFIEKAKQWQSEKLIGGLEIATLKSTLELKNNKKIAIWFNDDIYPGSEAIYSASYGNPVYQRALPFIDGSEQYKTSTGWSQNGMMGISVNSKYPKKAFDFAVLCNTNVELFNTMVNGIEGRDFKVISQNPTRIALTKDTSKFSGTFGKAMGSPLLRYLFEASPADFVDRIKKVNADTVATKTMGFMFDSSLVSAEIVKCNSVYEEYNITFNYGLSENLEKDYADFLDKLDKAGAQTIIAVAQTQYDNWRAVNGK